jgi:hypothetical protein
MLFRVYHGQEGLQGAFQPMTHGNFSVSSADVAIETRLTRFSSDLPTGKFDTRGPFVQR